MTKLPPMHPGEVLREEFMEPLGLTAYTLARRLDVHRSRIERIVREEKGIKADTALRLGAFFDTTAEFWMNLQDRYELDTARQKSDVVRALDKIHDEAACAA